VSPRKIPADRAKRAVLWDEREYRREATLAAVGHTGMTMSVEQIGAETGFGPGVAVDLELLAEHGLIGRVGDGARARFFPTKWAAARKTA
jgi:hypothetical protein